MIKNKGVCFAAQIYNKLHFLVADMKLFLRLEVYTCSMVLLQMEGAVLWGKCMILGGFHSLCVVVWSGEQS